MTKHNFAKIILVLMFLTLPALALAQAPCEPNTINTGLCNPLSGGRIGFGDVPGATDFRTLAIKFLFVFAGFLTLVPIMAVTFAGFVMVTSQGNEEKVTRGKKALSWAVYGFVMASLSFVLIVAMTNFLGAENLPNPQAIGSEIVNPLGDDAFVTFLVNMLTRFLEVAGIIAILILVFDGLRYITAAGNQEQAQQARKALTWVVAGMITILLSYVIIKATASLIGIE